jgi:hypothetical protein
MHPYLIYSQRARGHIYHPYKKQQQEIYLCAIVYIFKNKMGDVMFCIEPQRGFRKDKLLISASRNVSLFVLPSATLCAKITREKYSLIWFCFGMWLL